MDNPRSLAGEVAGYDDVIFERLALLSTVSEAVEVTESRGWKAIEGTIIARIEEVQKQAIMATSLERLAECRGMMKAYNTFLAIPRSVRSQQAELLELAHEIDESSGANDEEE